MGIKINHNYYKSNNKLNYNTLVIAPAITLSQWKEEIERSFDEKANIITIKKTEEFIKWYKAKNVISKSTYILIGKETFKLSYATEPCYNKSKQLVEFKEMDDYYKNNHYSKMSYMYSTKKQIKEVLTCPNCGKPLKNPNITSEDKFFEDKDFKKPNKGNYKCSNCDTVL